LISNEEGGAEQELEGSNNNQKLEESSFGSIVPTLIAIGDSPVADEEIQRHIVRALDNLSIEAPSTPQSKLLPCLPLINRILDTIKDEDIRKRALHVLNKLSPPLPSIPVSSPFLIDDQRNYFQQEYDDDISQFYGQPQNTSDLSLNKENNSKSKETKAEVETSTITVKTDSTTARTTKVDNLTSSCSISIENLILFDDKEPTTFETTAHNYSGNIDELNNNFDNISLEHNYNNEEILSTSLDKNNNSTPPRLPPIRQNSGALPALLNRFPFNDQ